MYFPSTFDEFAKDYGFKDKDEVYTNGSELIPVFRVKQWLEHISTTKNNLAVDIDKLIADCKKLSFDIDFFNKPLKVVALDAVKNIVKDLPSVTPQLSSALEKNSKKLEKDFGESDCISRQAVLDIAKASKSNWIDNSILFKRVNDLPLITPIRPKGHWITRPHVYGVTYCSECDFELKIDDTNYCPNCGADMREVEK